MDETYIGGKSRKGIRCRDSERKTPVVALIERKESYFSILKRAVYGTFHWISKKHLHRYCDEFDFRWNNGNTGMELIKKVLKKISGKRLVYKSTIESNDFLLGLK